MSMAAPASRKSSFMTTALMIGFLVVGLLLAAGHHIFYAQLEGTTAPTGSYRIAGSNVPKQRFNTAVGTAFAFLIKAVLAVAVWIAYAQLFWRSVRTSTKGERLSTLDTLFSVPQDLLSLETVGVWLRHPLLLLLAAIAW